MKQLLLHLRKDSVTDINSVLITDFFIIDFPKLESEDFLSGIKVQLCSVIDDHM